MIWPSPERILWLYKRWQPLYDVIKSTVYPSVEFMQGIPLDLDQDSFIHPRTRNLVILDDLMSTASKDSRINELFTEGSHHRNLSVIAINQNLYYNKDPTQRRNCHYMVLFNNPVDKQQIMTLSRQMYPENSQHLLRHFKEATSKPYGYLLVDLKPTTPEHLRMRTDIMNSIKPKSSEEISHFRENRHNIQTYEKSVRPLAENPQLCQTTIAQPHNNEIESEDMPSCDDCGIVFENMHDLQRHIKTWCPENLSLKRKRDDKEIQEDQPPQKWIPFEPEEKEEDKENQEDDVFNHLMKMAKEDNEKLWDRKYDKYIKKGLSREDARIQTEEKMNSLDQKQFAKKYGQLILYILQLQNGSIHANVMDDVRDFLSEGYSERKAIRTALNKNRHVLEEMWDTESEMETDEVSESEDEESQNDDSDSDELEEEA